MGLSGRGNETRQGKARVKRRERGREGEDWEERSRVGRVRRRKDGGEKRRE